MRTAETGSSITRTPYPDWIVTFGITLFVLLQPFEEGIHLPILFLLIGAILLLARHQLTCAGVVKEYAVVLALLAVPVVVAMIGAVYPERTAQIPVRWALYWWAGLYVLYRFRQGYDPTPLIYAITAILALVCIDALVQYFRGVNLLGFTTGGRRIDGVFNGQLILGNSVAHWSPFAIEAIRRFSGGRPGRLWAWLLVLPIAAVCLVSGNRSSWVVLFVMFIIYTPYLLYSRQIRWWVVVGGGAIGLAGLLALAQVSEPFEQRFNQTFGLFSGDYETVNDATANRMEVYKTAWAIVQENPVNGVGWRGFRDASEAVDRPMPGIGHAHLYGLDVLLVSGIIGFIPYLIAVFLIARLGIRAARAGDHTAFMLAVGAFLLIMPINTHYSFFDYHATGMMWVFLMLAYGAANRIKPADHQLQTEPSTN